MAKRERQPHMNFYYDMYDAGRKLSERERKDLYTAILDYFWTGRAPRLTGGAAAVFTTLRDRLDMSRDRSECTKTGEGGRQVDAQWTSTGRPDDVQVDDKWTPTGRIEGEGDRERDIKPFTILDKTSSRRSPSPPDCEDVERAEELITQVEKTSSASTSARANSSRTLGEIFEGGLL